MDFALSRPSNINYGCEDGSSRFKGRGRASSSLGAATAEEREHVAVVAVPPSSWIPQFWFYLSSRKTRPCRPSLGSSSSSPLPPPQPTATTTSTIDTLPSLSISIVEPYPPPRSSPIPIPFASKVDSLELELYSADPLPTRILPPLVKPFKSYLNTTLDSLRQIKHSLGRNSRSRVERSLAKLSESNPSVASSVLEVLARLASGDGSGFVMAYLGWVEVQVVDARDELEVLSKKKIGWDAFTEKQVLLELELAIEELGMYDNDQKMALLTRLSLWDQEVVEAVLRILISEELSNYHRLLEIKRVHCRFLSGRTRYPTTSTPPNLTIPELVILLLPPSPTSDFAAVEPSPPAPLATVASSNLDRPPSRPTTPSVAPSLSRNPAVEPPYPSTSTHTLPIDQNPLPSPPPPFLQNNQHVDPLASLPTFDLKASHPPNGSQPTSSTSNQSTAASDLSLDSHLVLPTLLAVDAAHQPSSSSDFAPFPNIRRWQKMEEDVTDPFGLGEGGGAEREAMLREERREIRVGRVEERP